MILFDRDGVLNELWREPDLGLVDSPSNRAQVRLTAGAAEAVRRVNQRDIPCAVVSNQPGVAKGKLSRGQLHAVTAEIATHLRDSGARLDRYYYCLHHPQSLDPRLRHDECPNRKPRPGLLLRACHDFGVRPADCWFIGDTHVDLRAGSAAGCRTAWIGSVRCDVCPVRAGTSPDLVAPDVLTCVERILTGVVDAADAG
ncbi:D-glycero-alpha-D-manno-heptose-1,7-bisphosphate 7-phosphatase [Phytohabitans sp. LJ34]|uniref:D-glycero-alpha-D-manno-heptose-1,7-bisphosphate 7-phosphatase n=1 Tax=Phytohabitans sp. LJ34 TaxID=3452217 RepID=UPI003F8CB5F3